jgi:RNA polymerase sigma factor (sigma-70 family)
MAADWQSRKLVEEASQGDDQALESLLVELLPGLRGYLQRNAGDRVLAQESSSDLLQSVCREVLQHLQKGHLHYRTEEEFRSWLFEAALFKLRDRWKYYGARKRSGKPRSLEGDPLEAGLEGRQREFLRSLCTPSGEAAQREELQQLAEAFAQLSTEQQQVITLTRIDGLPHREAATQLGVSETACRKLLSRALARLTRLARRQIPGNRPGEGP